MAVPVFKPTVKLVQWPAQDIIETLFSFAKKSVILNKSTFDKTFLANTTREEKVKFVVDLLFNVGHIGVADNIHFSFEIEDVNRALSHQAVRNRIAAFLECSLRYINPTKNGLKYVVPYSIRNNEDLLKEYQRDMDRLEELYRKWFGYGKAIGLDDGKSKELARTVLPHAASTGYAFTMSISSLIRLLNKRLCKRAEEPFVEVARMILEELRISCPEIFNLVGAHCEQYGYCPEGKLSCGKYPTLKELRNDYKGKKMISSLLD